MELMNLLDKSGQQVVGALHSKTSFSFTIGLAATRIPLVGLWAILLRNFLMLCQSSISFLKNYELNMRRLRNFFDALSTFD